MRVSISLSAKIGRIPKGQAFATRELLACGPRNAIDQALSRMVKQGRLERLTRGVFWVPYVGIAKPSLQEIILVKARAFGKKILTHGKDACKELRLTDDGNIEMTFATDGNSSNFLVDDTRIYFKKTTMPRMMAGESRAGLIIRAFADLKKENCTLETVALATSHKFFREDREQLKRQFPPLMAGWMSDLICHGIEPEIEPKKPMSISILEVCETNSLWTFYSPRTKGEKFRRSRLPELLVPISEKAVFELAETRI